MTWIEVSGTIFGLLSVWLTARESIWCWPAGIVNILLFLVMFAGARLYAELITYGMFLVMSGYGWWQWLRGGPRQSALAVRRMSRAALLGAVAVVAACGPLLGAGLARWTDAALPYLDSTITAGSLVAQALMTRKLLESWLFWIFIDVLGIGVYLSRGLVVTSGLYAVYLVLSVLGFRAWRRGC